MTKCSQESRMREIRTSGSTRGSSGMGNNPRPLFSTLLVETEKPTRQSTQCRYRAVSVFAVLQESRLTCRKTCAIVQVMAKEKKLVVDASAVLAVILDEPEKHWCRQPKVLPF